MLKHLLPLFAITQCCSGGNIFEYTPGYAIDIRSAIATIQVGRKHKCTGVLFHASWIVTTVTCIAGYDENDMIVSMGTTNANSSFEGFIRTVEVIIKHKDFKQDKRQIYTYNIALLRLEPMGQFILFSDCTPCQEPHSNLFVRDIAIASFQTDMNYKRANTTDCSIVSWNTGGSPMNIWVVPATHITRKDCYRHFRGKRIFDVYMVCMYAKKDICRMDAGAAVFCSGKLVGVLLDIPQCIDSHPIGFTQPSVGWIGLWIKKWVKKYQTRDKMLVGSLAPLHNRISSVVCISTMIAWYGMQLMYK